MNRIDESALGGHFAPTTTEIGYLRIDAERAAEGLVRWRDNILNPSEQEKRDFLDQMGIELETRTGTTVSKDLRSGYFAEMVGSLSPLTMLEKRREAISQCNSDWCSYLDNGHQGTDSASAIGHMTQVLNCDGIRVVAERSGSRELDELSNFHIDYFVPENTDWLNVKYTLDLTRGRRNECKVASTGDMSSSFASPPKADFNECLEMVVGELKKEGLEPFSKSFHCSNGQYWLVELLGASLPNEAEVVPPWSSQVGG